MTQETFINGDHAQYEIDNKDTPKEQRSDWPLPSFDARDWATDFCKYNPQADEANMVGWFANALMRGYNEGVKNCEAQLKAKLLSDEMINDVALVMYPINTENAKAALEFIAREI